VWVWRNGQIALDRRLRGNSLRGPSVWNDKSAKSHAYATITDKASDFAVTSLQTSEVYGEEWFVITYKKNPASADNMLMQSVLLSALYEALFLPISSRLPYSVCVWLSGFWSHCYLIVWNVMQKNFKVELKCCQWQDFMMSLRVTLGTGPRLCEATGNELGFRLKKEQPQGVSSVPTPIYFMPFDSIWQTSLE